MLSGRIIPTITVVAVTNTSSTLAALLTTASGAIATSTKRITLVPHTTGIYMDDGTASSSSHPMLLASHEIDGGTNLSTLQFWHTSGANMTVIQEG